MENRKRPVRLNLRVSEQERKMIEKKMEQAGTDNMNSYLRKMAIDGYVVRLDLPELRDMVSLLRRLSASLNQIAKRVNSTGRLYEADLAEISSNQDKLWDAANEIIMKLSAIS